MPFAIRTNDAWTELPYGEPIREPVQASYQTLELRSEDERNALGVFTIVEPGDPPEGKVETGRTLSGDDRPEWVPTYGDAPEPAVPNEISTRQFFQQLALDGTCTTNDALAYVRNGTLPASLMAVITTLPADAQFAMLMELQGANVFLRNQPSVDMVGWLMGMDKAALDRIWRLASTL